MFLTSTRIRDGFDARPGSPMDIRQSTDGFFVYSLTVAVLYKVQSCTILLLTNSEVARRFFQKPHVPIRPVLQTVRHEQLGLFRCHQVVSRSDQVFL